MRHRLAWRGAMPGYSHSIDITTKGLVGKLFSPLIARTLPKQTVNAMTRLKALAEA